MDKQLGRYELRRAVGRGAAGTVWDAWDTVLNRRVAVKVVRTGDSDDLLLQEVRTRFRQEAQLASRFSHPGVVQVHDYGEIQDEAFIVMEFVDGEPLKALLDRREPLPLRRAAEIMRGLLNALESCHRLDIVHRDIKPGNIMLAADGDVKLTDFGIARTEDSELTIVGTVMGTPPYMSPEQFTASDPVDARSDIWSAGVVFYELLTGNRPFDGSGFAAISQAVVNDPVEPPSARAPGLPAALDQAVLRALRKSPAERFPSAQAFWLAIQSALPPPTAEPPPRARPPLGLAAGIAAALLLTAAAVWPFLGRNAPSQAPVPNPAFRQAEPGDRAAGPSLQDQAAALPCANVTVQTDAAGTILRGVIGAGTPRAALDAVLAHTAANSASPVTLAVQTFPATPVHCRLVELAHRHAGGAQIITTGGATTLHANQDIRLRLAMPDFTGEVRLDDLTSDGSVSHLMEANLGAPPRHAAGTIVGLGRDGDDLVGRASPPFGSDLLVAFVSTEPLLAVGRPLAESGTTFLPALETALTSLEHRGGRVAAATLVLTTLPH